MDLRAEKYDIIERVMLLEDEETLLQIKRLLEPQEELSEEMKAFLDERVRLAEESDYAGRDARLVLAEIAEKYGLNVNINSPSR